MNNYMLLFLLKMKIKHDVFLNFCRQDFVSILIVISIKIDLKKLWHSYINKI